MLQRRWLRVCLGLGLALCALFGAGAGCSDDAAHKVAAAKLSEGCLINSDCEGDLVCAFRRCHIQCETSKDCDPGLLCVESDRPYRVCQLGDEQDCVYNSECYGEQACAADRRCRDRCTGTRDCGLDQLCVSATCAEPEEVEDGVLKAAESKSDAPGGQPCAYNSECAAPLACIFGACRDECIEDEDCDAGHGCVDHRCVPGGEAGQTCTYTSDCTEAGHRCLNQICRCECREDVDCPTGASCDGCACEAPTTGAGGGGNVNTGGSAGAAIGGSGNLDASTTGGATGTSDASTGGATGIPDGGGGEEDSGPTVSVPVFAYYPLDAAGGVIKDEFGTNHGTFTGGSSTTGRIGGAVLFNGSSDGGSVGADVSLNVLAAASFAIWAKPTLALSKDSAHAVIARRWAAGAGQGFNLEMRNGVGLIFEISDATGATGRVAADVTLPAGVWTHLVGTYDGTTIELYIDGVSVGTSAFDGGMGPGGALRFASNAAGSASFAGALDEALFYDVTLNDPQVGELFALGSTGDPACAPPDGGCGLPAPVSRWALDDETDTVVEDAAGSNHGENFGGVSPYAGQVGTAVLFDQLTDASVRVPPSEARYTTQLAVAAWVYPNDVAAAATRDQYIVNGASGSKGYYLAMGLGGSFRFTVFRQGSGALNVTYATTLDARNWYHVVGTYDGTNARLYVDGQLVASAPEVSGAGLVEDPGSNLIIGNGNLVNDQGFDGLIDEVVLYGGALSADEVAALHRRGLAGDPAVP